MSYLTNEFVQCQGGVDVSLTLHFSTKKAKQMYGKVMTELEKGRIEDACIDAMERYGPMDGNRLLEMPHNNMKVIRRIFKEDIREDGWKEARFDGNKITRVNKEKGIVKQYNMEKAECEKCTIGEAKVLMDGEEEEEEEQFEEDEEEVGLSLDMSIYEDYLHAGPIQKEGYSEYIDLNNMATRELIMADEEEDENLVDEDTSSSDEEDIDEISNDDDDYDEFSFLDDII